MFRPVGKFFGQEPLEDDGYGTGIGTGPGTGAGIGTGRDGWKMGHFAT